MSTESKAHALTPSINHYRRALYKIEKIATVGALILMVYLAVTESLAWVPFAAGIFLAAVLLLVRWPFGALAALTAAAAMPRYHFSILSWNAKPEHLIATACCMLLLPRLWRKPQTRQKLDRTDALLLAFLALGFVSSYIASPDRAATFRWSLLFTLATLPFFLIPQMCSTEEELRVAFNLWLSIGAAEALFGILCFLSYLLFGTTVGVTFFFYLSFIPGVHGSQWEPNIFGSFCACFAVMFLYYYLTTTRRTGWYMLGFMLTTVGTLLSLARQSWICLVVVGAMVFVFNQRGRKIQWKRLLRIAAGVLIALGIGANLMEDLPERLGTLAIDQAAQDPTIVHRLQLLAMAAQDISEHPIIGLGSSSFQLMHEDQDELGTNSAWLGNFFVRVVHDTGIIGLIVFMCFLVLLGRRVWKVQVSTATDAAKTTVNSLAAGTIVLLIAYQLTDASTLTFTWIQFGMLAAATRIAEAVPVR